jgi:SAM-dependent methyltransferase
VSYIAQKHLAGQRALHGVSLGCGTGFRERRWAREGIFSRLDGYDLSPARIIHASQEAAASGLADVLRFHEGDARTLELKRETYDVVLCESALHHFSPLTTVLDRISRWLRPGGFLLVDDFIGPTRMQWTARQLEVINSLLHLLPARLRMRSSGSPKDKFVRPSRLSMWLSDRSEAVESGRILPLLHEFFNVVEVRPYGGSVLHMLLSEIAHNFPTDDLEAQRALRLCFEAEDLLLECGELANDFAVVICRRRSDVQPDTPLVPADT